MSPKFLLLLLLSAGVSIHAWGTVAPVPSESECRPYIEKALKELSTDPTAEAVDAEGSDTPLTTDTSTEESVQEGSNEGAKETVTTDSAEKEDDKSGEDEDDDSKRQEESIEAENVESLEGESLEAEDDQTESGEDKDDKSEDNDNESEEKQESIENTEDNTAESQEAEEGDSKNESEEENEASEVKGDSQEEDSTEDKKSTEDEQQEVESVEEGSQDAADETAEESSEKSEEPEEETQNTEEANSESEENIEEPEMTTKEEESEEDAKDSSEKTDKSEEDSKEKDDSKENVEDGDSDETREKRDTVSVEDSAQNVQDKSVEEPDDSKGEDEKEKESTESAEPVEDEKEKSDEKESKEETEESEEEGKGNDKSEEDADSKAEESEEERTPEEDLTIDVVIPEKLRSRDHIGHILKLDTESAETELLLSKTVDITLRELKRLYDTAIQPLEILYKYRDLSNRHFGDPEIFSKPLILFMGPWSGGKSTIINYLLDNEYANSALRTGAEPSPAYFNILMWGEQEEVLDGTQLAADWTFSGLQKFGQGLLDRLRGLKLKSPLLEKVNIVEIPGILEIRKQVERLFPFNDACQWFIDRADIIFLVYDPSKLDVGPETEAILDQLKGREYQTRIILNKADQVKPEELMRVQGTLIWNISPLMSSSEPPVMYSTSLWSIPYEVGSPSRLLFAQEKAFLKDLRDAIDKRVENKIASARRFAVRVRNHAKMVDCYLTTYYNHKTFFGNRKKVADDIIEHPQNYHIYEGLSTLTNISRYDLPDPEVYRDFFRLNPVYDFQKLSATCTYFRGCPINRLDIAIAYDLPELVGKYKKSAEAVLTPPQTPPKS